MKKLPSFIISAAFLFFAAIQVQASCPGIVQHPPCVEFWRADAVFVATAAEVQIKPQRFFGVPPPITVRFTIEEIFKGIEEKEIVLELEHCGYQFKQGEKYLVYAHLRENKLYVRIGGTRTEPIAEATDDLDYLRSLQRGEPQAQIVGKVGQQTAEIKRSDKSFYNREWRFFGSPMTGVKVFAKGAEQTYETFSDAKGEYKFFGLPTGEYEIWADYPSYFTSEKQSVKTAEQGCGIGNIMARRKGSISGRIVDANGAVVSNLRISLVLADAKPEEILEEREDEIAWILGSTDEKGEYRFEMLPAGRYLVVINRANFERTRGDESAQKIPRLFYPGVKSIKAATVISLKEGEQVKEKDFRLPKNK